MEKVSFKIGSNVPVSDIPYSEGSLIFLRSGNKGSIYVDLEGSRTQYSESYDDTDIRNLISTISADSASLPRLFLTVSALPTNIQETKNVEYSYESAQLSFTGNGTMTCKDQPSSTYPKRDYILNLSAAQDFGWGDVDSVLLRSNYVDHTHMRNLINAQLWAEMVQSRQDFYSLPEGLRESPNKGATMGYPIRVYVNGVYQGIYTLVLHPTSGLMYGMDPDDIAAGTSFVLRAQQNTNTNPTATSSNLRATTTAAKISSGEQYKVVVGNNASSFINAHYLQPLNNFITFVSTTDDEATFKSGIGNYLDIWSAIDYYLFAYYACGLNMLAKYQLFLCYDGQHFIYSINDNDGTWGLYWDGRNNVAYDYRCPEQYEDTYNILFARLEQWYPDELYARWNYLKTHELSKKNILTKMENFWYQIGLDLYNEDFQSTPYTAIPSRNITDINQLRTYVNSRFAYVNDEMNYFAPPGNCTNISITGTTYSVVVGSSITLEAITTPHRTIEPVTWNVTYHDNNNCITYTTSGNTITITGVDDGYCSIVATCGECESEPYNITVTTVELEEHILASDYSPQGATFNYVAPIEMNTEQFIEVAIDLSGVSLEKENVLSIGEDIGEWKGNYPHIHCYVSASTKNSTMNVDVNSVSGYVRKAVALSEPYIVVRLDEEGLMINNTRITDVGAWPSVMADILALPSYNIGSMEGKNRSHATYDYIKYYEAVQ